MRRVKVAAVEGEGWGSDEKAGSMLEKGLLVSKKKTVMASGSGDALTRECSKLLKRSGVDLWWSEKMLFLLDWLQMFAILWSLSQPWPWPYEWLVITRWTVVANLDFMALGTDGAAMGSTGGLQSLWGEHKGYLFYSALFSLLPLILGTMLFFAWFFRSGHGGSLFRFTMLMTLRRAAISMEAICLSLATILFLPVTLVTSRLFLCDSSSLSVDPSVICWTGWHMITVLWMASLNTAFWAFAALRILEVNSVLTPYTTCQDHERHLQLLEIESAVGLGFVWRDTHVWLLSSFQRPAAQYRLLIMGVKLCLVIAYSSFRSNLRVQAMLFWSVLTAFIAWSIWVQPFRVASSNTFHSVLLATLWCTCFLGMLKGYGAKSGALVAQSQYFWLLSISSVGCLAAIIAVRWTIMSGEQWPCVCTLARILSDEQRIHWLDLIRQAREMLLSWEASSPVVVPLHEGELMMQSLRLALAEAKAADSLLELSLRESLQDIAALHEDLRPVSVLPGPNRVLACTLEDPLTIRAMHQRKMNLLLMRPQMRRILVKLLAVSAFLDRRRSCTPPSAPMMTLLLRETSAALEAPLQQDSDRLRTLSRQWKRIILKWENDFERKNGVKPSIEDKMEHNKWYEYYRSLHGAADQLAVGRSGSANPHDHPPQQLTLALAIKTEKLLASSEPHHDDQQELMECKREWKTLIRNWERDFERANSRKPGSRDKGPIATWYRNYTRIAEVIKLYGQTTSSS